jgi:endonuclease I
MSINTRVFSRFFNKSLIYLIVNEIWYFDSNMNNKSVINFGLLYLFILGVIIQTSNGFQSENVVRGNAPNYSIGMNAGNAITSSDRTASPVIRTKTFSIKNWGTSTSSTYLATGVVSSSLDNVGTQLTLNNFVASTGQVRGNSSADLNFMMFNTIALPGAITGITLKVTGGTLTGTSSTRNLLYLGTTSQENVTSGTATNINEQGSSGLSSMSWTVSAINQYTFFKVYHIQTSGNAVADAADAVTITYEDYSLSKSYKTVNMQYKNVFPLASHHVQLGATVSGETGRIYNDGTTQITSITSVLAIFTFSTASGGSLTLTTGSSGEPTTNVVTLTTNVEQMIAGNPYFLMIKNTGTNNVYLESLTINYSCIPASGGSSSEASSSAPVSSAPVSSAYTYTGYYASIQGVSDANLKTTLTSTLRSILNVSNLLPSNVTYGNARTAIPQFDKDPNNSNNVILVYSQTSVTGFWDGGDTWNREHVFPQSLMGVDTDNNDRHKGADYHNLKPESPSVNSSRGNKYFAETTTTASYAPPAVVRGDIARILFYMVTMWPELSLVDVISGNPAIYTIGQLSLFVKWHLEDPVDAFEDNRNEVIYGLQGNRNPFVDHEELVCRIWGPSNVSTQGYCAA